MDVYEDSAPPSPHKGSAGPLENGEGPHLLSAPTPTRTHTPTGRHTATGAGFALTESTPSDLSGGPSSDLMDRRYPTASGLSSGMTSSPVHLENGRFYASPSLSAMSLSSSCANSRSGSRNGDAGLIEAHLASVSFTLRRGSPYRPRHAPQQAVSFDHLDGYGYDHTHTFTMQRGVRTHRRARQWVQTSRQLGTLNLRSTAIPTHLPLLPHVKPITPPGLILPLSSLFSFICVGRRLRTRAWTRWRPRPRGWAPRTMRASTAPPDPAVATPTAPTTRRPPSPLASPRVGEAPPA